MQAWQIQDDHTIKLASMTTPEPGPDQVRVKVRAMGVNRADILQVKGLYPAPPGFDSSVPGLEYAGEIEAVGSQVMGRKVGDRVMGLIPGCAYSEYLVTHERETLTLPDEIDFATGATIPEAFLTAYRAMFLEGGLQPGQWVLVRPATAGCWCARPPPASAWRACSWPTHWARGRSARAATWTTWPPPARWAWWKACWKTTPCPSA